eukprot:1190705-Prorocentrum_minimum.AAC.1
MASHAGKGVDRSIRLTSNLKACALVQGLHGEYSEDDISVCSSSARQSEVSLDTRSFLSARTGVTLGESFDELATLLPIAPPAGSPFIPPERATTAPPASRRPLPPAPPPIPRTSATAPRPAPAATAPAAPPTPKSPPTAPRAASSATTPPGSAPEYAPPPSNRRSPAPPASAATRAPRARSEQRGHHQQQNVGEQSHLQRVEPQQVDLQQAGPRLHAPAGGGPAGVRRAGVRGGRPALRPDPLSLPVVQNLRPERSQQARAHPQRTRPRLHAHPERGGLPAARDGVHYGGGRQHIRRRCLGLVPEGHHPAGAPVRGDARPRQTAVQHRAVRRRQRRRCAAKKQNKKKY